MCLIMSFVVKEEDMSKIPFDYLLSNFGVMYRQYEANKKPRKSFCWGDKNSADAKNTCTEHLPYTSQNSPATDPSFQPLPPPLMPSNNNDPQTLFPSICYPRVFHRVDNKIYQYNATMNCHIQRSFLNNYNLRVKIPTLSVPQSSVGGMAQRSVSSQINFGFKTNQARPELIQAGLFFTKAVRNIDRRDS